VDRNYVEKSDSAGQKLDIRQWTLTKPNSWPPAEAKLKQVVGKESNKLQTTPLGRTVAEFIYNHYDDIFAYNYTSYMEQELDKIAKGVGSWTNLLQTLWDSYKERYTNHLSKPNPDKTNKVETNKKRDLGEGISVILSRKGPLLLKEETKEFASLPPRTSFDSVTLEQAKQAYKSKDGDHIGNYLDDPILKKKGPYGFYAEWQTIKVPLKPDDTEMTIIEKIKKKQAPAEGPPPYSRVLGDYTIKQGPYGLYFFKHTLKKATFVTFPQSADKDKVTSTDLDLLYKDGLAKAVNKRRFKPKDKSGES
jgi:DNA topoisomerase-1